MITNTYNKKEYNISMDVDGIGIDTYTSFDISTDVEKFVDTFSISLGNMGAENSKKIPIGGIFSFYVAGVLFFRGIVESKQTNYGNVGSTITLSGREEMCFLSETAVDPTKGPFKNMTDNEIIKSLTSEYSRDMSLGEGKTVKEYALATNGLTIGQVIQDITKSNEFVFFKRGITLYKKKIPVTSDGLKNRGKFILNLDNGKFMLSQFRILSLNINEDISSSKSRVTGYSYEGGKAKAKLKSFIANTDIETGAYASRIRNLSGMKGYKLNRSGVVLAPAKDKDELDKQMKTMIYQTDMKSSITMDVYGIFDAMILDSVNVSIEPESIFQTMYISGVQYKMDGSNKVTTTLTVKPFIKLY